MLDPRAFFQYFNTASYLETVRANEPLLVLGENMFRTAILFCNFGADDIVLCQQSGYLSNEGQLIIHAGDTLQILWERHGSMVGRAWYAYGRTADGVLAVNEVMFTYEGCQ